MSRTRNKWREARDLLIKGALRKPVFGTLGTIPALADLEANVKRLMYVLNEVSAKDPRAYSFALQSFLAYMNIDWPDGVFRHDYGIPNSGRPLSQLSVESWRIHKNGNGWRLVAMELIPDECFEDSETAANSDKAANRVRKAARSFARFRDAVKNSLVPPVGLIQDLLSQIIWIEGLERIANRVVTRKLEGMKRDVHRRLPTVAPALPGLIPFGRRDDETW
jgi:hypothetical protein